MAEKRRKVRAKVVVMRKRVRPGVLQAGTSLKSDPRTPASGQIIVSGDVLAHCGRSRKTHLIRAKHTTSAFNTCTLASPQCLVRILGRDEQGHLVSSRSGRCRSCLSSASSGQYVHDGLTQDEGGIWLVESCQIQEVGGYC